MSYQRISVFAAAGLLVAVFAVPGSTSAAPSPHRKPSPHTHVQHRSGSALRAALARGPGRRPAPIPHVDPQLQVMPASANGTIEVTLHGKAAALAAAVKKVSGRSIAAAGDAKTAIVARSALATLAGTPGVSSVDRPVRAYPDVISEGVAASNASAWQTAGQNGAGVKVGVVDVGFANLSAEITAGNLPADTTLTNNCANVDNTDHGTAVSEIVHQMAPGAQLFLYCIDDAVGFQQAEQAIQTAGDIKIVNSSLGFPGDSRGDGTGSADSAATTVKTARQAGILWIQSAGNNGVDHWSGTLTDADHDGLVDINGTGCQGNTCNEVDAVDVIPGGSGQVVLKWDNWPTVPSAAQLELDAYGFQCSDANCTTTTQLNGGNPLTDSQAANQAPVLSIALPTNSSAFDQEWDFLIQIGTGVPAVSYDLSYWGSVTNSFLSNVNPTKAAMGSITEPASSPYAFAVGATDVQDTTHSLEPFSSQGPTIDARVKPDITGFDDVSSNLADLSPFFGTSSAAPHVAGAAALVAGANPAMDAAQIQDFLERRAGTSPPNNQFGHGVLNLGDPNNVTPPVGSGYTPLASPQRILDTRTTIGGHQGQLGAGQVATVAVPGLPPDATAVAINLTGTSVRQDTFLASYPGNVSWPGTSNLNLTTKDSTAAVFVAVTLGSGDTISVRNSAGSVDAIVDLLGYYAPSAAGKFASAGPTRIVDTRHGIGGHTGALADKQSVRFAVASGAGVPSDATSLVVNVTVTGQSRNGNISLSPDCSHSASTVNYLAAGYPRANLTLVGLDASASFCAYNAGGSVHLIVDLLGYIGPSGTALYVPLTSPVRIVDTRYGNGGQKAPLGARGTIAATDAGIFDVPYTATALLIDVISVSPTATSWFQVYPGTSQPASRTSTLNFTAGRVVSNAAITGLTGGAFGVYNDAGNAHAVVDLFGYFV